MKVVQSSIFRAIVAIIVGALLIEYREDTMRWLTIAIGVLFFLSGVISIAAYYGAKKHYESMNSITVTDAQGNALTGDKPSFPIVGAGSAILGVILAFMTEGFITYIMYILAFILILGSLTQFINLASARKYAKIGFAFWILPCIILLVGIFILVRPMESASTPLLIIGWCMLLYGVVECINALKIHSCRKAFEKMNQQNMIDQTADAEEIKE